MGRYQWRMFAAVSLFAIFAGDVMHMVFVGGHMEHWCHVQQLDHLPYDVQKHVAIPAVSRSDDGRSPGYSSCEMYALNYSAFNVTEFSMDWNRSNVISDSTPLVKCDRWNYDQSLFTATIVSKVRP